MCSAINDALLLAFLPLRTFMHIAVGYVCEIHATACRLGTDGSGHSLRCCDRSDRIAVLEQFLAQRAESYSLAKAGVVGALPVERSAPDPSSGQEWDAASFGHGGTDEEWTAAADGGADDGADSSDGSDNASDVMENNPHGGSKQAWKTLQLLRQNLILPDDSCYALSSRLAGSNKDLHSFRNICSVLQHSPETSDLASAAAAERALTGLIRAASAGCAAQAAKQCTSSSATGASFECALQEEYKAFKSRLDVPALVTAHSCGNAAELGLRVEQTRVSVCNVAFQILNLLRSAGISSVRQILTASSSYAAASSASGTSPVYSGLMSGKAAQAMQQEFDSMQLPLWDGLVHQHVLLPLAFFIDGTHLASGREIEGVYVSLAQDQRHRVFLGEMPSGIHCMGKGVQRQLLYQLAVGVLVQALRDAFIRGVRLCIGGVSICVHPYVLIAPLDWKASHEFGSFSKGPTAKHNCMMCDVCVEEQADMGRAGVFQPIDHRRVDRAHKESVKLLRRLHSFSDGTRSAMDTKLKDAKNRIAEAHCMCISPVPCFVALLPVSPACSGWSVCVTEPLHLMYQGLARDLLDHIGETRFKVSNAKERFDALLGLQPGLRMNGRVERGGKWFTGKRRSGKLAQRVLLQWPLLLADISAFIADPAVALQVTRAVAAAADLEAALSLEKYTESDLAMLAEAIACFIAAAEAVDFSVVRPKVHLLAHMAAWIELFGSPIHWDGAGFESLHIAFKALAYGNSGSPLQRWASLEVVKLQSTVAAMVYHDCEGAEPAAQSTAMDALLDTDSESDSSTPSDMPVADIFERLGVSDGPSHYSEHPAHALECSATPTPSSCRDGTTALGDNAVEEIDGSNASATASQNSASGREIMGTSCSNALELEEIEPLSPAGSDCTSNIAELDCSESPGVVALLGQNSAPMAVDALIGVPTAAPNPCSSISYSAGDRLIRATQPDLQLTAFLNRKFPSESTAYRICRVAKVTFAHSVNYYGRPRADACFWTDPTDNKRRLGFFVAYRQGTAVVQQLLPYESTKGRIANLKNGALILHHGWHGAKHAQQVHLSNKWLAVRPELLEPASVAPLISMALLDERGKYHVSRLISSSRWIHTRAATNDVMMGSLDVQSGSKGPVRTWLWLKLADSKQTVSISA